MEAMQQENDELLRQIKLNARISLSPESWTDSESSMELDMRASCERDFVRGATGSDDSSNDTAKDASASSRLRFQKSPASQSKMPAGWLGSGMCGSPEDVEQQARSAARQERARMQASAASLISPHAAPGAPSDANIDARTQTHGLLCLAPRLRWSRNPVEFS